MCLFYRNDWTDQGTSTWAWRRPLLLIFSSIVDWYLSYFISFLSFFPRRHFKGYFIQLFCFWSELFRHDGDQETTYTCAESAVISARYWKYVECKPEVTYPLAGIFLEAKDFRQRRASSYGRTIEAEMTLRASVFSYGGSSPSFSWRIFGRKSNLELQTADKLMYKSFGSYSSFFLWLDSPSLG
jgi:hypothetical protein